MSDASKFPKAARNREMREAKYVAEQARLKKLRDEEKRQRPAKKRRTQ